MDIIYRDREGGAYVYWTYSDGAKVAISETTALRLLRGGRARIVRVA